MKHALKIPQLFCCVSCFSNWCCEDHCLEMGLQNLEDDSSSFIHTICALNPGADRNTYDEITGEAETLDILTFVKEQMENG